MDFKSILLTILIVASTTSAQSTQDASEAPETFDPAVGGKYGNPGAQLRFSNKGLDEVYKHAIEMIARALKSMDIPDVIVPVGGGMLTIKGTRITEASIPKFDREMVPPNRIKSHLEGGKIISVGQWQFRPMGGVRSVAQGVFRTIVYNATLNITNQLAKTWDNKPSVQTSECKARFDQFRVEIEGFGENTTTIDECSNLLCQRIRSYFEDAVCNTARQYAKDTVNRFLSTFQNRIYLGPVESKFVLNYDLLNGEPKVTKQFIQAYLKGEVLARGVVGAPFHAPELDILEGRDRMISFPLSDYAFNTLLHHAHAQQFKFSAYDMLQSSDAIKDQLKLNCSDSPTPAPQRRSPYKFTLQSTWGINAGRCLGAVFDNVTVFQYPIDAIGDLVFKSQRQLAVVVRNPQKSYFGTTGGVLEAYGSVGSDKKRELLGRVNVELLRGEFVPAINGCNITGRVNITDLQLTYADPSPIQARIRSMSDVSLNKFAQFSIPVLKEMFNAFFDQYAQFPVPLIDGYQCSNPEFRWSQRTIQIDSDVKVSSDGLRKKNRKN